MNAPTFTVDVVAGGEPVGRFARSATADGAAGAALGNNADLTLSGAFLPAPGAVKAWHLRSIGRDVLKAHGVERRMRWCGSRIARRTDGVNVYRCPDRARGRVTGICVCAQSICCPVCAPRIAAKRSAEVAECFLRMRDAGMEVRLETFTKPHVLDRRPSALIREIDAFVRLWERYQKNASRRERGAKGHHLGREVNWGENGWHYHHHRARYDLPGTFDPQLAEASWWAALDSMGLLSDAAKLFSYDCAELDDVRGATYVAKLATMVDAQARAVGREVASGATKGRSINSLLADYAAGDMEAGVAWLNGVSCITAKKVSSLRWSRGLEARAGMNRDSDETVAEDEVLVSDEFLGALNPYQWQGIIRWRAELSLLLCANAKDGRDEVNKFLAGLNLGQLNDEDPRLVWRNQSGIESHANV